MWYKLYIRYWYGQVTVKHVQVENKWDLFAIIGWIYSTTIEKIERIDYEKSPEPDVDNGTTVLHPPRQI